MDFNNTNYAGIEENELFDAQIHLHKYLISFISSMALKSVVELGIADAIYNHGKPMTLVELASSLKFHHPSKVNILYRLMRLLTHDGFFAKTTVMNSNEGDEETTYGLTPLSKLLITAKSTCLAPMVHGGLLPCVLDMWDSTNKWFHEDKELTLFERATGESFWNFLNRDSESDVLSLFQKAMEADSNFFSFALPEFKHVFEGLESLVDVGGGTGGVTKLINEAFPHLKCTVFDQPEVVGHLTGNQNLNFVGGDMFKSIPPADVVLLKWILHNWNDEQCLKILKNSKEAISHKGKDGKVIIIDISIDEISDNHKITGLQLNFDLLMVTLYNGKERRKKEWEKLIFDAGFTNYKITSIGGFKSRIEIYP